MLRIKRDNSFSFSQANKPCVPLKKVTVDASIKSFAADVTIKQTFRNDEDKPIEAVYCFPIEEQAAIYSFIARIDDREIVAQLKEKKQAQQEYNDALHQGHGAYLLEQDEKSQDNFIINVGALLPGKECLISISYVAELSLVQNGSRIQLVIPTTIAPRYNPEVGSTSSPAGTTSQYVQKAPYTIEFHCRVDKWNVSRVSSTSHPIQIQLGEQDAYHIEFAQENTHLDRDILVDIELTNTRSNTIIAVEPGAIMASFAPSEEDCQRAMNNDETVNEFIFVVDCSGSMKDENKIELAREAMLLFLKSLPVRCHFNIIRFGSYYEKLFDKITAIYNEVNVEKAQKLIDMIEPDMIATQLLQPLQWLAEHPPQEGHSRQVFLLTDGEIKNTDEVLDLCRSMATSTRIFSFGLGHSPSRSLVKGLARTTNGRFVFIPPNTSVDVYVGEQLQKALQSSITNIQVKWNVGTSVMSAPTKLPPVYANDRLITYAVADDPNFIFDHNASVELYADRNRLGEAKVECIPGVSQQGTIGRLAAKARILELQHSKLPSSMMKKASGSLQSRFHKDEPSAETTTDSEEKEKNKKRIIELSLKYQILSPHTAFVGVEKRVNTNNADMVLREVPIQISVNGECSMPLRSTSYMPISRSSTQSLSVPLVGAPAVQFGASMPGGGFRRWRNALSMFDGLIPHRKCFKHGLCRDQDSDNMLRYRMTDKCAEESRIPCLKNMEDDILPTDDTNLVRYLIKKQKFDGLWDLNAVHIKALTGKSLNSFSSFKNRQIVVSAAIIIVLETRFASFSPMWYGIVQKSRNRVLELLGNDIKQFNSLFETIHQALST